MNKVIFTLFIIWVIYKALRQGSGELRRRMEEMTRDQSPAPAPPLKSPPKTATGPVTTQRQVLYSQSQSGGPTTDESAIPATGSELETWFREAIERKRALQHRGETEEVLEFEETPPPVARPIMTEPSAPPRPQPARQQPARQQPRQRRSEPRPAVHEQRRREVRPREPMEPKRARRRRIREKGDLTGPPRFLAGLDQRDIRKGIVLAEILGTPKGLRDIDTHVI